MAEDYNVFLSYSHNDQDAATNLRAQLDRHGLSVFRDRENIREGDLWLKSLQEALEACGSFVLLIGRDGVRRWIGAETQVALSRYFGPHDDASRLPIFPILLDAIQPDTLPAFIRLFQGTPWNGSDPLPETLLRQIHDRAIVSSKATFEGCPFVGLDAYRPDQAKLFFGRQKETLGALACFDTRSGSPTVRWLEISGNSGSGKSSLMNAGILPLVDQGWLWPRTGLEKWRRIGPIVPGDRPVAMLAEHLARSFGTEMADIRKRFAPEKPGDFDERALADWLRSRKPDDETAFLLAIDQFEELFTLADPAERGRFDRLLATALEDSDCPLFVISTVRSDFLDRFDNLLPRLAPVRPRKGKLWPLPLISSDTLREIISGPARLAGLDVSEVQETMIAEARGEPGALPLVQNALYWLWQRRADRRLSGPILTDRGGLAGILSQDADDLLRALGGQRHRALELLFWLVKVDPEGRRHTRQRMTLAEAVAAAGGGKRGHALIHHLAGARARVDPKAKPPLRVITVTEDAENETTTRKGEGWVDLIHETLIRSKGPDAKGQPQPYWPTLWNYIEQHKDRPARRERLKLQAREWKGRKGLARLFGLAGWLELVRFRGLAARGSLEQRYLRWSRGKGLVQAGLLVIVFWVWGIATSEGPAYLEQPEKYLGLWKAWYGTDHRVFHEALLYPYGLGLRTSGYIVGIEKGDQDKVGGMRYRPELLVADSASDTERFEAIRERLETDRKAHLITHVIRTEARVDAARPLRVDQCVLYTALDRPADASHHDDAAGRLFERCGQQPVPVPAPTGAVAASWTAIASLRDALTQDLESSKYGYTDILVVVMGWNTAQAEVLENVNSLVGHLLDEAAKRHRAFRPLVIAVTWPLLWALYDLSVVPTGLVRLLSFQDKADDAEELGATWLRDVISYAVLPARAAAQAAMKGRSGAEAARVVLVGHSFGARALVAALTQRPQLEPPGGMDAQLLQPKDPVLLLEGAFEIERLFDRDASVSPTPATTPAQLQQPFSAGDPVLTLTASEYDTAVRAALWGWYAGDSRTYDKACAGARDQQPWRGLDLSGFGCSLARDLGGEAPYGLDLCQPNERQGTAVDLAGKRVAYFDASHMINCNAPFTGGDVHSDIYRRETARFLLERILASP